ncbi:MAG: hypothetical protein F4Y07_15245 [Gemmatimonadetes bacterium]|nr:hypothetical protein [Gemmatimonadota bacterium]
MAAADRFDSVVEELYKAAVGDIEWVSVAGSINDLIRTNGHSVTQVDLDPSGKSSIHYSGFFVGAERRDDLAYRYYRDYYWRDEAIPRLQGLRDGELVRKSNLYTDQEKKTSAAYNEYRRVYKNQNGFFLGLHQPDSSATVLSFGDSTERRGWGHDQIQMIRRLAPHMRQFGRIRRVMASADALGASLAELLENRRWGIMQLDHSGRILDTNDLARGILLKCDGLSDTQGTLVAGSREENEELQRLLAHALPRSGVHGAGGSMRITRRKVSVPLVLEIHPVRQMGMDDIALQVRAMVLVIDPAARPLVDPVLTARLLRLTPAEGRVAVAVATGQTLAGAANALGCAESTVRTHLKRVYRKQGISKRSELVRRILSLEGLR